MAYSRRPAGALTAIERALRWAALPVASLLVAFNLRRLVFALAAIAPDQRRSFAPLADLPSVLVLVPCRNEAMMLPGLIASLAALDYPADRLRVALIDDGSTDETFASMKRAAAERIGWQAIRLEMTRGKAQALNDALAQIDFGEIVVVYDADHRPEPDSLRHLIAAFAESTVAGASGRTIPRNALDSLPAYYASVESLVHQMITLRAKDRLGLAPALLGSNCAYRRSALEAVGGFRPGALLEDSELTLALAQAGYRLRFAPGAIAWHQVPESIAGYVRQHVRWGRGFNDAARERTGHVLRDRRLPLWLRIELAMFSLGYLDRLALLAAIGLKLFERVSRRPVAPGYLACAMQIALAMPPLQIAAAFAAEHAPLDMWLRLPAMPLLFGLDMWAATRAALDTVLNRSRLWAQTSRSAESPISNLCPPPLISIVIPVRNGGPNFACCLDAIRRCDPPPHEIIVVDDGSTDDSLAVARRFGARLLATPRAASGPAEARNIGAQAARGDVVLFVDADVAIHADAIGRVRRNFEADLKLAACFGSYDDSPDAPNFLAQYKNLFHHYVHQSAREATSTFWAGCGAIRRDVFLAAGGFSCAYMRPSIEDIELGYRLRASGFKLRLDKRLLGKHLKRWTWRSLLRSDILDRGVPWVELILRSGAFVNDLNLQTRNRISVAAFYLMLAFSLFGLGWPIGWVAAGALALMLLVLNRSVYRFFAAKRGLFFTLRVIPMHWLYYGYNGVSFAIGAASYLMRMFRAPAVRRRSPAH